MLSLGLRLIKVSSRRRREQQSTMHVKTEMAWQSPISLSWNWPHSQVRDASASISASNPSCEKSRPGSLSYRLAAAHACGLLNFQRLIPKTPLIGLLELPH